MRPVLGALLGASLLAAAPASAALAATVSPEVSKDVADGRAAVVALLRHQANLKPLVGRPVAVERALRRVAAREQRALLARLAPARRSGAIVSVRRLWALDAVGATVTPRGLDALRRDPAVRRIVADRLLAAPTPVHSLRPFQQPGAANPTAALAAIHAPAAWARGLTGQGMRIGILDTGVWAQNPALAGPSGSRVTFWRDYAGRPPSPTPVDPDTVTHGTAVASLAAGDRLPDGHQVGVAPDAQIMVVRVLDENGGGSFVDLAAGAQAFLDPDGNPATNDQPQVVNVSLGGPGGQPPDTEQLTHAVVRAWRAADILPVFAAGNDGCVSGTVNPVDGSCSVTPTAASLSPEAAYPDVLSVGAESSPGIVAGFSSRGPSTWLRADGKGAPPGTYLKPDLVAPGFSVPVASGTGGQAVLSGTSFAAPLTAGAALLVRQAHPDWTAGQTMLALRESAVDLGSAGPDADSGWGELRIDRALDWEPDRTPPALSADPTPALTRQTSLLASGRADDDRQLDEVTVNGRDAAPDGRGNFSLAIALQPGPNTIVYRAVDLAGNVSTLSHTVTLDDAGPTVAVSSPSVSHTTQATLLGTVADDASGVTALTVDGHAASVDPAGRWQATIPLAAGTHVVVLHATDGAGNASDTKAQVIVDLTRRFELRLGSRGLRRVSLRLFPRRRATLRGRVTDGGGRPVAGERVLLRGSWNRRHPTVVMSRADGRFSGTVRGVRRGLISVSVPGAGAAFIRIVR